MTSFIEPKKRVPIKLKTKLSFAFGFDYGDIQDNRSGFISHWQKKRLRWHLLNYSVSIGVWAMILSFVSLLLLRMDDPMTLAIYFTGLFGVLLMFWLRKSYAVWRDIKQSQSTEIISQVRPVTAYRAKNDRRGFLYHEHDYFVDIDGERFPASREQMRAFTTSDLYVIYIAPASRQILSVELLDEKVADHQIDFLEDTSVTSIQAILETDYQPALQGKEK